jgi:hypothetical protein
MPADKPIVPRKGFRQYPPLPEWLHPGSTLPSPKQEEPPPGAPLSNVAFSLNLKQFALDALKRRADVVQVDPSYIAKSILEHWAETEGALLQRKNDEAEEAAWRRNPNYDLRGA